MISVRPEELHDRDSVRKVNEAAFGRREEAGLVEALHSAGAAAVALVAEIDGDVVGHIVFSPVSLEPPTWKPVMGLGPMAVAPGFQRRGVGTLLVRTGLDRCRRAGVHAVVVVGHPEYYPRFGFKPAAGFGLRCEYDVPPDVFMAVELEPDSLRDVSGVIRYHHAFATFE